MAITAFPTHPVNPVCLYNRPGIQFKFSKSLISLNIIVVIVLLFLVKCSNH